MNTFNPCGNHGCKSFPPRRLATVALLVLLGAASALSAADGPLQPPYSWRGIEGTGVFPARGLVTTFCDYPAEMARDTIVSEAVAKAKLSCKPGNRQNIVWRTLLPHWGHNAPVCVKDKVFLLCGEAWKSDAPLLVCLDVQDGKILWQHPVDHMDAWPEEKAKLGRECRAKELKRWRGHMIWWNRFYWDNQKHAPAMDDGSEADWNKLLAEAKEDGWEFPPFAQKIMAGPADCGNGAARYRYGLRFNRGTGQPTDRSLVANYKRCNDERYYWYPGWTSEGPFYGSTMGSVVSDSERVYAVTTFGAMAAFDFEGNRKWIVDLAPARQKQNLPCTSGGYHHFQMASPVLADGLVIHFFRDAGTMYAVESSTGKLKWHATSPSIQEGRYVGYSGHMGPGGTPVVMRLPDAKAGGKTTTVAISGNGMVVRASDGKKLEMIRLPSPAGAEKQKKDDDADAADDAKPDSNGPSSTYNSWTAWRDVLYAEHSRGWVYAIKLALDGDALKQEMLWRSSESGDSRDPNLVYHDGRLYCGPFGKKGWAALDAATGRALASGPRPAGYSTSLGVADGKVVMRSSGWSGGNARYTTYSILSLADLKAVGTGLLVQPKPQGEVAERHIAFLGTPYIAWGVGGITCWGNRIFIRSNDYLWCIRDTARQFVPPEQIVTR